MKKHKEGSNNSISHIHTTNQVADSRHMPLFKNL